MALVLASGFEATPEMAGAPSRTAPSSAATSTILPNAAARYTAAEIAKLKVEFHQQGGTVGKVYWVKRFFCVKQWHNAGADEDTVLRISPSNLFSYPGQRSIHTKEALPAIAAAMFKDGFWERTWKGDNDDTFVMKMVHPLGKCELCRVRKSGEVRVRVVCVCVWCVTLRVVCVVCDRLC